MKANKASDKLSAARELLRQSHTQKHNNENKSTTSESVKQWFIMNQALDLVKQRDAAITPEERLAAEKAISEFRGQHGYF